MGRLRKAGLLLWILWSATVPSAASRSRFEPEAASGAGSSHLEGAAGAAEGGPRAGGGGRTRAEPSQGPRREHKRVWADLMQERFADAPAPGLSFHAHWSLSAKGAAGLTAAMQQLQAGSAANVVLLCARAAHLGCDWVEPLATALRRLYPSANVTSYAPTAPPTRRRHLLSADAPWEPYAPAAGPQGLELRDWVEHHGPPLVHLAVVQLGGLRGLPPCGVGFNWLQEEGWQAAAAIRHYELLVQSLTHLEPSSKPPAPPLPRVPAMIEVAGLSMEEDFALWMRARVATAKGAASISLASLYREGIAKPPAHAALPSFFTRRTQGALVFTAVMSRLAAEAAHEAGTAGLYAAADSDLRHAPDKANRLLTCRTPAELPRVSHRENCTEEYLDFERGQGGRPHPAVGQGGAGGPKKCGRRGLVLPYDEMTRAEPRRGEPGGGPLHLGGAAGEERGPQSEVHEAGSSPAGESELAAGEGGAGAEQLRKQALARLASQSLGFLVGANRTRGDGDAAAAAAAAALGQALARHAWDRRGQQARARLARKLRRGEAVRIAVFGGSVPAGHHLAACRSMDVLANFTAHHPAVDMAVEFWKEGPGGTTVPDTARHVSIQYLQQPHMGLGRYKCAYSAKVVRLLLEMFPNANISAVNYARGAMTVAAQLESIHADLDLYEAHIGGLKEGEGLFDLVLVDFVMNDGYENFDTTLQGGYLGTDWKTRNLLQEEASRHEALLRVLWRRCKGRAAVAMVEWMDRRGSGSYLDFMAPLLAQYRVATLSLEDFWQEVPRHFREESVGPLGMRDREVVGPGPFNWRAGMPLATWRLNQLLANLIGMELLRPQRDRDAEGAGEAGPARLAVGRLGPPLFCDAFCQLEMPPVTLQIASLSEHFADFVWPSAGIPPGWRHGVDTQTNIFLAWLSNATALTSPPITFPLRYTTGYVEVTILKTYEHIGDLRVWVESSASFRAANATPAAERCDELTAEAVRASGRAIGGPVEVSGLWPHRFSSPTRVVVSKTLPPCEAAGDAPCGYIRICPVMNQHTQSAKVKLKVVMAF